MTESEIDKLIKKYMVYPEARYFGIDVVRKLMIEYRDSLRAHVEKLKLLPKYSEHNDGYNHGLEDVLALLEAK